MNSSKPLVSIIIPTYNHATMLREALKSVQSQTMTAWEAVVVNNFSTDDTIEVVNSFNDSRIKLINFSNHGIIAASRNKGIRHAKSDLIAFLDSDDIWYPEKLEQSVAALASGADLACHGEIWQQDGSIITRMQYGPQEKACYQNLLLEGNCLSTSAVVVRKQKLLEAGCFSEDDDLVTAEDYDLWLKLALNGARFVFPETILGEYRIHGGNASKAVVRNMAAELSVIEKHFSILQKTASADNTAFGRRKAITRINGARRLLQQGAITDGIINIVKAFRDYPPIPFTIINKVLKKLGIRK